jgi:DNA-binding transcriptional LysR family regulator
MPNICLDLALLKTFVTVSEAQGFTRAGERLGLSQPAVSLQMKRLEESVGRQLVEREARGLMLTPDGEILLGYAREMLRLNDEARARLSDRDVEGVVRLGTPEDFATTHLPDVLARFARSHPRVALDVKCELTLTLLEGLSSGTYDMVLVKREPQGPGGGVKVWREPLVWVASPTYSYAADAPVPIVCSPHPCVYRKRAINSLNAVRRPWRIIYTSPSLQGVQAAVRAGLGVTILPKEMVPQGFHMLSQAEGFPELDDTEIALVSAPGTLTPAAARLAEHIVRSLETSHPVHVMGGSDAAN